MAAWRSILWATLCAPGQSCWLRETPCSAKATFEKTRENYWKQHAPPPLPALDPTLQASFRLWLWLMKQSTRSHARGLRLTIDGPRLGKTPVLSDSDLGAKVDILDGVEELDAFLHGALERFAAGNEASAASTLIDDG